MPVTNRLAGQAGDGIVDSSDHIVTLGALSRVARVSQQPACTGREPVRHVRAHRLVCRLLHLLGRGGGHDVDVRK